MEVNVTIVNLRVFLKENDIEMYSAFNEGKSVVAERFIKIYQIKSIKR